MKVKDIIVSHPYSVIVLVTLLTRLPFIFNGYGVEEDSYGLVLTAQQIAKTGVYEISRAPGHPVQELILSLIPNAPAFIMNGLSMLFGMASSLLFYVILRRLSFEKPIWPTLFFTMAPVFYVASTYTIDYTWALTFILLSFWFLFHRNSWLCGMALALAVGCRVTSVLFALPIIIYYCMNEPKIIAVKKIIQVAISSVILVLLLFLPAYMVYGTGFFYTYPLPYPPLPKVFYKGTIGVLGVWGCVAMVGAVATSLMNRKKNNPSVGTEDGILVISWVMIVMHLMLFLLLPEKSAFFIPALPFFFLLIHHYLSGKKSYALWGCMFLMSPFLSSVQLIDKDRGSLSSGLSIDKVVLNQDVSFDFIYGPIISDYTKRLKKDEFVVKFIDKYQKVNEKSVILCGFWTNHIVLKMRQKEIDNPQVIVVPGMSENDMIHYRSCSYRIYYLREQEQYNTIKYHVSPLLYGDLFIK